MQVTEFTPCPDEGHEPFPFGNQWNPGDFPGEVVMVLPAVFRGMQQPVHVVKDIFLRCQIGKPLPDMIGTGGCKTLFKAVTKGLQERR